MYELEPDAVPVPDLPGEVVVALDADEVIDRVAEDLVVHAENCVREFGDFHCVVCGGEVPGRLYRRLMYDPQYRLLPWRRTHLWLAHEDRPRDEEGSVWRQVHDFVGEHADIPAEQMHPILVGRSSAATDYERLLRERLGWREKGQDRPDYVLLELRGDGTVAGLAGDLRPEWAERFVVRTGTDPADPAPPISMLPRLLNAARFVAVLVTGATAGAALPLAGGSGAARAAPVRAIAPSGGELRWYLDRDAAEGAGGA